MPKKKTTFPNKPTDVKLVQALLKQMGYWDNAIDGNFSLEFVMMVMHFQKKNHLERTGEILPDSHDMKRLLAKSKGDYKRLTAKKALNSVYSEAKDTVKSIVPFKLMLSDDESVKLFAFLNKFQTTYNIPLTITLKSMRIIEGGFVSYRLQTPGVKWMDNAGDLKTKWTKQFMWSLETYIGEAGVRFEGGRVISSKPHKGVDTANKLTKEKGDIKITYSQSRHGDIIGLTKRPNDLAEEQIAASFAEAIHTMNQGILNGLVGRDLKVSSKDQTTLYAAVSNGIMTDAVAYQRPQFIDVWNAFHKKGITGTSHIADIIGGKVQKNADIKVSIKGRKGGWVNFCAVRISYALNKSGEKIPFIRGKTVTGAKKNWYLFRLKDVEIHLQNIWGNPDVHVKGKRGTLKASQLNSMQGILLFDTSGAWSDATGHFTFWDGKKTVDKTDKYFSDSVALKLWRLP